jgi:2-methylcitrate dehydratase PrpD
VNETRIQAAFVAGLRYADLPPAVVDQACRIMVDTLGCAISAWTEDPAKAQRAPRINDPLAVRSPPTTGERRCGRTIRRAWRAPAASEIRESGA